MRYHYVYRITNINEKRYYYGKRTSKIPPKEDLGKIYFSSSRDKDFQQDQRKNPENYKYKVICVFPTSEKALCFEIRLHAKFNVGKNPKFYNKAKQTSTGFSTFGISPSKETLEKLSRTHKGRKHTEETKRKQAISKYGNSWNKGRKHSPEAITKMKAIKGHAKKGSKPVNIFCYSTDTLVAANVVLNEWCGKDKSLRANLASTLRRDLSKPSSKYNPYHSKGLYAEYAPNV